MRLDGMAPAQQAVCDRRAGGGLWPESAHRKSNPSQASDFAIDLTQNIVDFHDVVRCMLCGRQIMSPEPL
jgi:hypothetical protein